MNRVCGAPYMLWAAVLIHSVIGIALILRPTETVRFLILSGLNFFSDHGVPIGALGALLIAVSFLAALGLFQERKLPRMHRAWVIAAILPQYIILMVSFTATVFVIGDGVSPTTGNSFDRLSGIAAASASLSIAVLHTLQILDRYGLNWHKTRERLAIVNAYEGMSLEGRAELRKALGVDEALVSVRKVIA